jgi:hypothetical protein
MEDFKFIFYILLAVGYFLFSFFRKYFKEDHSQPKKFRDENEPPVQRPKTHQRPPVPVTSFEDIMRELQTKVEQKVPKPQPAYQQSATPVVKAPEPKVSIYEHKAPVAVSLERNMPKRKIIEHMPISEAYTIRSSTTLRKFDPSILRNPTTARDAFILSEIFNRKY